MIDPAQLIVSGLTGLLSGMILSIPVGPVNLTIMNEGSKKGFYHALMIGFGASLMETIYCALAFTGFASFFSHGLVKAAMEVSSFFFLMILGIKFLTAKSVPTATIVEERVEGTFKPHSAFMRGFVRVLGNPGVLLFWIILAANFISREWVMPTLQSKSACILGVALGTSVWFTTLSILVGKGYGRLKDSTLLKMERGSGVVLLVFGLVHGGRIIIDLAHAQHKLL
jgi:threonine/homoserine/homoserine lactone efflux protein